MSEQPPTDALGRQPIADGMKRKIDEAFRAIPPHKRGALIIIADTETKTARAHLAAKVGDHWKIAGGAGWVIPEKRPSGWIAIEGAW